MSSEKITDTSLMVSKIQTIENDLKLLIKTMDHIDSNEEKEKIHQKIKSSLELILSLL